MGIHTLNTRDWSHALISVQNFWRPWNWDGKASGKHGVQGAALSRVMGNENPGAPLQCLRAGMAAQVFSLRCIMELSLYWQAATLLCIQAHFQDKHHSWSFYKGWVLLSEHFYWSYNYCEQDPSQQGISNISIAWTTGQGCHTDKVNSFIAVDYLCAHRLSSGKNHGRVIHIKVIASFNPQSLMETKFLRTYNTLKYPF